MNLKVTYAAKVGFWVLLATFLVLVLLSYFGIVNLVGKKQDEYFLHFNFPSVRGLNKGAKVKINGSEVGIVEGMDISPYSGVQVLVKMYSKNSVIHENADVIITKESLLGSSYIEISEPISGVYQGTADSSKYYYVQLPSHRVIKGDWIHLIQSGQEKIIGQIEAVEASDYGFDKVLIKNLDESISVDSGYMFVPKDRQIWDNESGKFVRITYMDVYSPLPEGAYFEGRREAGPEDLIAHVDEVVVDAGRQMKELNQELQDVLQKVQDLLENVESLIDKEAVEELFDTVKSQIEIIGSNVEGITTDMSDLVNENKPRINATMQNIEATSKSMKELVEDPELHGAVQNITRRVDDLADQIEVILNDIEEITSDPNVKKDVKESIHTVRETLKTTEGTVKQLQKKLETVSTLKVSGEFKSRYSPDPDKYFSDIDLFIHDQKKNVFYTVGIDDIGEDNLFNAQLGYNLSDSTRARFGIKRSKVGFGMDYHLNRFFLKSDLYDPNEIIFNLCGGVELDNNFYLVVGGENLFNEDIFNLGVMVEF